MAEDTDVWSFAIQKCSSTLCELSSFIQNMTDGDAAACQFDHGLGRKSTLFIIIDIVETAMRLEATMLPHDHKLTQFGKAVN